LKVAEYLLTRNTTPGQQTKAPDAYDQGFSRFELGERDDILGNRNYFRVVKRDFSVFCCWI